MIKKVLNFSIGGWASIDTSDVVFFDEAGKSVDTSNLSLEQLQEKLNNFELEFDWVSLVPNAGFNIEIEDPSIGLEDDPIEEDEE